MNERTSTIMLADDNPATLKLLEKILSDEGYDIITAGNGTKVFEMVKNGAPDLFLLDVMMPDMDGLEVCRLLKQDKWLNRVPVVFITARDGTEDLLMGFEAGGADYITKPVNKAELLARVSTHVRLYHSMLELERLNRLALDANPSTGLPGNNSINKAITRAIKDRSPLCIIYCDLDDFKAFNDKYGFARGDRAIKYTADLIQLSMKNVCGPGHFIGHIGGDDFILIVPSEKAKTLAEEIIRRFDGGIKELYDQVDVEAGGIISKDRRRKTKKFPIMSLSVGGVDMAQRGFEHYLEVANACAEVKKAAKEMPGSSIFFDRRQTA